MPCCGNSRAALKDEGVPARDADGQSLRSAQPQSAYFQYVGRTGLRVRSEFSQRAYRFDAPLAVVEVDGRDAPWLAAIPQLRRVKAPT